MIVGSIWEENDGWFAFEVRAGTLGGIVGLISTWELIIESGHDSSGDYILVKGEEKQDVESAMNVCMRHK